MSRAALALVLLGSLAHAEPRYVLRMATVAPDGTMWAREMKAFAREIETVTHGEVRLKWYWGAIARDEDEVESRILREQLDGTASGGITCMRMSPTLRALRVPGLFRNREEASYVVSVLKPRIDEELSAAGFVDLTTLILGGDRVFFRRDQRALPDLGKMRFWRWASDETGIVLTRAMGVPVFPSSLDQAGPSLESGELDGMMAIPAAVLAFQWFGKLRAFVDWPFSQLPSCLIVTRRAFERLPQEHQRAVLAAGAKLRARADIVVQEQEDALIGGLFERQGLRRIVPTEAERQKLTELARAARERSHDEAKVPAALIQKVLGLLTDFRTEHEKK